MALHTCQLDTLHQCFFTDTGQVSSQRIEGCSAVKVRATPYLLERWKERMINQRDHFLCAFCRRLWAVHGVRHRHSGCMFLWPAWQRAIAGRTTTKNIKQFRSEPVSLCRHMTHNGKNRQAEPFSPERADGLTPRQHIISLLPKAK